MPLDPQVESFLTALADEGRAGWEEMTPTEAREVFRGFQMFSIPPVPVQIVEDELVDEEIEVRIYDPENSGNSACIMYMHGGGWVFGDLDSHDSVCRQLADCCRSVVVAVNYRLAPENPFPVPLDDCFRVYRKLREDPAFFGIDPERIAVVGDSAGGNLAAAVSLRARDEGLPLPAAQLLIYPVIDAAMTSGSHDKFATGFGLTRAAMQWFWNHYLPDDESRCHSLASLNLNEDLSGLPPTRVLTAEYDVLRDEGEAFAAQLKSAGVDCSVERFDGLIHGFFHFTALFDRGKESVTRAAAWLRDQL